VSKPLRAYRLIVFSPTTRRRLKLSNRLVTAAVAELADAAMVVQQQLRRTFGSLQSFGVSEKIFRRC
jgi:hypothetical protein